MEYYNVGKIVNTHGVRGEVRVLATTDFIDERFAKGNTLYLQQSGEPLPLTIESTRQHKGFVLVKFVGYDNINDVEKYKGCGLYVTKENRVACEKDEYFIADLIGLSVVTDEGQMLGNVTDVISTGANDVYVVLAEDGTELLLPAIHECIRDVDVANGRMQVHLLDGLLDV